MDVFLHNFVYLSYNSFLALIPILFGSLMLKTKRNLLKVLYGFIWLTFLPNTIYIATDISHLFEDWPKVDNLFRLILIMQYTLFSIVGIITFVIAINFFRKLLEGKSLKNPKKKIKITTFLLICILNFMVGFAVVLGGIERTNSWYIITDPIRVINDVMDVFSSHELLILSLGFGLLANLIYFLLAKPIAAWSKKCFKK